MVIYKPHWQEVYSKASEILADSRVVTSFPFSTIKLIKEIADISFSSFENAKKYGVDPEAFGSDSAFLSEKDGKHIIFFNQKNVMARKKFSILHEFAHFLFKHNYETKDENLYDTQEVEANFFTAQILMPEQILRELMKRGVSIDESFLMNNFCVSRIAANKRIRHLNKTRNFVKSKKEAQFDDLILKKYEDFIDNIKSPPNKQRDGNGEATRKEK